MPYKKLDKVLDSYASEKIAKGGRYSWWWNGNDVLAVAIASLCRHVREDGCTALEDDDLRELETLERYMRGFAFDSDTPGLSVAQERWLYAEAMWLLGRWFIHLWD